MKIGFWGTPEIAEYYLEQLLIKHEVVFVVTGEDKPVGRHKTPVASPVKKYALEKNITVFQPASLLDMDFLSIIAEKKADIFIVVAYGKIIPPKVFNMAQLKTINIHPSLLPKYRGAAPIQWALINGESETGVTIQYINEKLDAGDILLQKKIPLSIDMTAEDLFNIVLPFGFNILDDVLNQLSEGKENLVKQNESEATYCGKINRETAHIDWGKSAFEIHNLVRGLNPKPIAWTEFKGKNFKIYKTKLFNDDLNPELKQGFLLGYKKRLIAGTGKGYLEILELQPETKKIMDAGSFINGYRLTNGDFFGAG